MSLLAQLHAQEDHLVAQIIELGLQLGRPRGVPGLQLVDVALGQVDVVLQLLDVGVRDDGRLRTGGHGQRGHEDRGCRHSKCPRQANQKHQSRAKRWQRYEKPLPGHRLQMDVKFLERIPGTRKRLYQFTAIDDYTRIRILKVYDACKQGTAVQFVEEVLRRLPFRVLVIQTDNGAEFQSRFHWHLEARDIRHVYIRPRTPHLNGKVERSHRVDDQEFYQLLDQGGISDDIHLFNEKLRE